MIAPGSVVAERSGVVVPGVDASRVSFRSMSAPLAAFVSARAAAITLGRTVFIRPDAYETVIAGTHPELVAHELVHVRQWIDDGPVMFLTRYACDYLRLRILGCDHDTAYRGIGYEWSAYSEAAHIVARP